MGTHNQLLESQGAYATLVTAQELAVADKKPGEEDQDANLTSEEAQAVAENEKPGLERTTTGTSLSSEILKNKTTGSSTAGNEVIGYPTIAKRFWK